MVAQESASIRVLVIDTDPGVRWALETGLTRSGYEVVAATSVSDALTAVDQGADAVVMEILPEAGLTLDVLTMITKAEYAPKAICVSVDASPQNVIACLREGAADFMPKPYGLADIRDALRRALDGESRPAGKPGTGAHEGDDGRSTFLVGISPVIRELRTTIQQVARTNLNCLLRGASGSGKDMVAREIHRLSARRERPFIKVNCTALPEQLLESELFGYEKGAFTGAVSAKPGRFELANNGVIFLDEIGDLELSLQAKLLQVIEHKEFTKLGGRKHIQVDVQIIAATNADLEARTKDGTFRDDLYFRLNEVSIWVPPLAERREDIPLLVRHFLQKHARPSGRDHEIRGEDLDYLTKQAWPGNVRELESTIKRWLALGKTAAVRRTPTDGGRAAHLAEDDSQWNGRVAGVTGGPTAAHSADEAVENPDDDLLNGPERRERARILEVLRENRWNRRKTAETLGMSYQTLRRRIEKYKLTESSE